MKSKKILNEYRMDYWKEVLRSRVSSGLSISAYCAREGFHPNKYYYWQRKIREETVQELLPLSSETSLPVPSGWTQLTETESKESSAPEVTIEIGRSRLKLSTIVDEKLLEQVCKVLVGLC